VIGRRHFDRRGRRLPVGLGYREASLIEEQGFEEQAQSYRNMESAADMAASARKKAAGGAEWGAALQFGAGAATFVSKAWPALALLA
jgi:hypothetical protein